MMLVLLTMLPLLCSPGISSTPRRRPRSGASRTPSAVGSLSQMISRTCPRPLPSPWR